MGKTILLLVAAMVVVVGIEARHEDNEKETSMTKKVALVVASSGFQQDEYHGTYNALVKAGIHVTTVSDKKGEAVASDGSTVHVDMVIDDVKSAAVDGIFLIGGRGALKHLDTPVMHKILNEVMATDKAYGAICISPRTLAHAQVLKGKKATCWDGDNLAKEALETQGVIFVNEPVVTDGKVVTANGPLAATEFGQAIVKVL